MKKLRLPANPLLALLSALLIAGTALLTDARLPIRLSRQPVLFSQMQALVTPENPAVLNKLHELVGGSVYDAADVVRTTGDFSSLRSWVRTLDYVSDEDAHGVPDYWQTPTETIALKSGDCEDIAILFVSLLRAYGVPPDETYIAVGVAGDNWHAYVFEKCFMGMWRALDPQLASSASLLDKNTLPYVITYCFNDYESFRGMPAVSTDGHIVLCGAANFPWERGASTLYYRELKAGDRVSASVRWLVGAVNANSWESILFPWSLTFYGAGGEILASWSGTEAGHTLEYTAEATGACYLEILKRDGAERYFSAAFQPEGWEPAPAGGFKPEADLIPDYSFRDFTASPPEGLINPVRNPPPPELVSYTLSLINSKWAVPIPPMTTRSGSATFSWGGYTPAPLVLGENTYAQSHAEDMLAKRYYALWDSNGLMPRINHFLAGSPYYMYETVYFTRVNWTGPKDGRYLSYLKTLLDGVDAEIQGDAVAFSHNGRYLRAVDIGIAYDDEYLFLVLDYETAPLITFDDPPAIVRDGVVTLSGKIAGNLELVDYLYVSHFRPPQALTPAQLNSTGIDYLVSSGGTIVAWFWRSDGRPVFRGEFENMDWPAGQDPLFIDVPSGAGLETREQPLKRQEAATRNTAVYRASPEAWRVENGSFFITIDLSKVVATFGPGIYTVTFIGQDTSLIPSGTIDGSFTATYCLFLM